MRKIPYKTDQNNPIIKEYVEAVKKGMPKRKSKKKKMEVKIRSIYEGDQKTAEMMQKIIEMQYDEYGDIIDAIVAIQFTIEQLYGIKTDFLSWNKIMEAVIKRDINKLAIDSKPNIRSKTQWVFGTRCE